MIWKYE